MLDVMCSLGAVTAFLGVFPRVPDRTERSLFFVANSTMPK